MRPSIKKLTVTSLLLVALCAPLHAVVIPDWVRQAASKTLPAYPPDTNAVVLLCDETDEITGPGEYIEHYRRVVKILRPDGRREGDFEVSLGQKQKLLSLHAWSIDKTGREFELKEKDFEEKAYSSFILFDDLKYRSAKVPAADPGSIVAFEYEVRRPDWDNQTSWFLQENIPILETSLTLQLPSSWEFKDSWAASAAIKPVSVGDNSWQWTQHNLAPIEDEQRMPAPLALSARMTVAFFPPGGSKNTASWEGVGRWTDDLTSGRRTPTPEITEKAHQLTAGKGDFDGKLRALTAFMQTEIRYVAIEIGIGGWQPHPAGDVFHYRYGDCKDKATLLSSMLHEVGIRSNYVIIHTERGVVDPALPSTFFNHAILAVELPDATVAKAYRGVITAKSGKQYLIFDPTDTYTPVGNLRAELQDTYALLVTDSGGEAIHTPLQPPETNVLTRTGHFSLDSTGALRGEVAEILNGEHAFQGRIQLLNANEKERTEHFERALGRSLKGFTLQNSSIEQLDDIQKDLLYNLKFTAPDYAQIRGPLMLVRPRVMGEKSFDLDHRKPRLYPVEFDGTSKETDVYEIDLPAGYTVDDVPDPTKIDVGFASYQSKVEVTGSKLRYSREYTRRTTQVGPEKIPDLRKFEGAIGADEMAAVVLKKTP